MSKKWIETWLTERPNVHEESHSEGPMGDCPWVECRAAAEIADLREKCERLQSQVNDLHAGCYINCVYCGHRYGPDPGTPVAMADVLKAHIEECPDHPMSELKRRAETYREGLEEIQGSCEAYPESVFPEMESDDWTRVRFIVENAGYTLDRLSASYLRMHKRHHLGIARETLEKGEKK